MNKASTSASPQQTTAKRRKGFSVDSQTILLLGVFVALMIFFSVTNDRFLTVRSITSMSFQLPEIGVLSLAMMLTILIGGINLSVNATSNLAAVISGFFLVKFIPASAAPEQVILYMILAVFIALLIGALCGVIN